MSAATFFHRIALHTAKPVVYLLGALATFTALGCGGESRVSVVPVSGKVTFQGTAPAGAQVVLHPLTRSEETSVAPSGTVKEDGSFQISAYDQGDGAPPGDYVATVQWFRIVAEEGGSGRGPNVLPVKYASPETSPVKVTVKGEATQLEPIDITY
jgi:hypothetical protein